MLRQDKVQGSISTMTQLFKRLSDSRISAYFEIQHIVFNYITYIVFLFHFFNVILLLLLLLLLYIMTYKL